MAPRNPGRHVGPTPPDINRGLVPVVDKGQHSKQEITGNSISNSVPRPMRESSKLREKKYF